MNGRRGRSWVVNELGTVNNSLERNSEYALTRRPDLVLGDYQYVISKNVDLQTELIIM